jgi:hypothetical protein
VASGDQARIERAIQPVEALDSDTAAWLRTQAASYEYDRLNRLLPPEVQR